MMQPCPRPKRLVKLLTALLAATLPCACSARLDPAGYPEARHFQPDPLLAFPGGLPPVEVFVIDTGRNSAPEALLVGGGRWFTSREVSYPAILVTHPAGNLLIDAGLGADIDAQFEAHMPCWLKPLMRYEDARDARAVMLASQGAASPDSIEHILLTHPHWDHAGGLRSFPQAKIWHPAAGIESALQLAPDDYAFFAEQIDDPGLLWRPFEFTELPYENFKSSYDFYGDGSIVLVPLPGHTEASMGVFVNRASGQRYFFTGDTTWLLEGFERPADKFWFSSWIVDRDKAGLRRAIVQVHELMKRYPDLIVIPTHDARALAELPQL